MAATTSDNRKRYDVLQYPGGRCLPVPAGDGKQVIGAHMSRSRTQQLKASLATGVLAMAIGTLGGFFVSDSFVISLGVGIGVGTVAAVLRADYWSHDDRLPELVVSDASEAVVRDHVDEFDPDDVSDPFS